MFCFFFSQILIFPSEIVQKNSHHRAGRKTACGARSALIFDFLVEFLSGSERFGDLGRDLADRVSDRAGDRASDLAIRLAIGGTGS